MTNIFDSLLSEHESARIISVGLLLPDEQKQSIIQFSHTVARSFPVEYKLDSAANPPYVRLYETVFPVESLSGVNEAVRSLATAATPILMKWNGLEIDKHNLILWGILNEALASFHSRALEALNPWRKGYYKQKYSNGRMIVTEEERQGLRKWGSPWAENYIPHVVVAKSASEFSVNKLIGLEWEYGHCELKGLVMGEKTPHGGLKDFRIFPFR